ncbi:hypothetical protein GSH19_06675 [Lactobacillus sp. S2-2]|uniref:type II secretion system F family protein n=1 Tax=Lactobacillus sp. S2-2 TaxID=2692917 RepID=UPI001F206D4F|nr:type II secretion system F family protein [Lactobacillus sp. S2-2]MCF6515828.1 hypothetical protein [Lactobacillus sp. S2-2]
MKILRNMNSVNKKEQMLILNTLYNLLKTGVPLKQSINFMKVMFPKFLSDLIDIEMSLRRGSSISDSLDFLLENDILNQLIIAEKQGNFINGLKEIIDFLKLKKLQIKKIKDLMLYPIMLCFILFLILFSINTFIIPQFDMDNSSSNFYLTYIIFGCFLIIFTTTIIFYYHFKKLNSLSKLKILLKIPLLKLLLKDYLGYYLALNLSLMLKKGLEVKDIINVCMNFDEKSLLRELTYELDESMSQGNSYSLIIEKYSFIPDEFKVFLEQGNSKTEISYNFLVYSKLKFQDLINKSNKLITFIQPLFLLVIGIVIVIAYLKIMLPMYGSIKGDF